MDRDNAHSDWQDLSGRIKRRWKRLSDQEIAWAEGDREYLVGKVHERYGLARDEIDAELEMLGVGGEGTVVGPRGSQGYANTDNLAPPGCAAPERASSEDLRIGSEMDAEASRERDTAQPGPGRGWRNADTTQKAEDERHDPEPQDLLKDRGTATQSGRAASVDQPEHAGTQRRRVGERRS